MKKLLQMVIFCVPLWLLSACSSINNFQSNQSIQKNPSEKYLHKTKILSLNEKLKFEGKSDRAIASVTTTDSNSEETAEVKTSEEININSIKSKDILVSKTSNQNQDQNQKTNKEEISAALASMPCPDNQKNTPSPLLNLGKQVKPIEAPLLQINIAEQLMKTLEQQQNMINDLKNMLSKMMQNNNSTKNNNDNLNENENQNENENENYKDNGQKDFTPPSLVQQGFLDFPMDQQQMRQMPYPRQMMMQVPVQRPMRMTMMPGHNQSSLISNQLISMGSYAATPQSMPLMDPFMGMYRDRFSGRYNDRYNNRGWNDNYEGYEGTGNYYNNSSNQIDFSNRALSQYYNSNNNGQIRPIFGSENTININKQFNGGFQF